MQDKIDIICPEQKQIDITCRQQDQIDIIGGQGHPKIDSRGTAPNQIDITNKAEHSRPFDFSPLRLMHSLFITISCAALLQTFLVLHSEPTGHFEPYPLQGCSLEPYRCNDSCPSASFSDACRSTWPTEPSTFSKSRKKTNQQMRAYHGNATCPHCSCDLYYKVFYGRQRYFQQEALPLKNGMLVHHYRYCSNDLSLWFYRKGLRQYQVCYGQKAANLYGRIIAARAARGKPGDHESAKQYLAPFFGLHRSSNRVQLDLSGRESRSASEGTCPPTIRRSPQVLARRLHQFRQSRRDPRRHYRQWISSVLESGKFTLARPRPPRKRVNNSPAQLRRAYQSLKQAPTIGSRATLFKEYVLTSLLDLPQRRLNWRPASNRLNFVTWNIETLIGLGKYETLASFVIDILMLQETKPTSSNEIISQGGKYLLSGTPTEPSAGVGFYVSPRCLPLVQDFLPFSGRLAALILRTQPLPTVLITVYAPSMLQDPHDDRVRKNMFWDSLPTLFDLLPSPAIFCLAGDFNARVQTDSLEEYSEYVGPAVFPHEGTLDPDSNYGKMLDFLIQHDYSLVSSLHSRPSSRIITYKEISASSSANHNSPSTSDFAAIDHVLVSRRHCRNILSTSSKFEWKLPWFHRHFPIYCVMTFDRFLPPKRPKVLKTPVPQTDADRIKYKEIILASPLLSTTRKLRNSPCTNSISIFTDGSCPNQLDVRPGNPAGWAFTFKKNFQWVDSFGPVGQHLPFTPIGSNNSGELQAVIEALDFYRPPPL